MAIFEKPAKSKTSLDDTQKLLCTIQQAQNINKYTEYVLRVQRGQSKENIWNVSHRYNDFAELQVSLQPANIDLPLPPKKLIGNMQPSFIAERQIALQNYINEVLKHQILALSLQVRHFLDPNNYQVSISEQALQSVSIALRGTDKYELKGPLPSIGWRIRKHYFVVTEITSRANCLLAWVNYGPDRHLTNEHLQAAFKSLFSHNHPYIDQILAIQNLETGAFIVRKVHENGSIRDMLYGTEYSKNYLLKYGNPKVRKPFTIGQIAHYGLQILQAVKYLHTKGFAHGHIHPGNITIDNHKALLLDVENILLGVPCLYRPYLVELKRACHAEAVDVYCFGRTLYEMAFGTPLETCYCDEYPEDINPDLEYVLRMCLSSTFAKRGVTTLDDLLGHPLFSRAQNGSFVDSRTLLKFPGALEEELRNAIRAVESNLESEQKLVRRAKRDVRIQEILESEEEMRKHVRRAKKRGSVWKSSSSISEMVRWHSTSTASSPTPPNTSDTSGNCSETATTVSPSNARSALLDAICSFDKNRLARVNSQAGRG